MCQSRLDTWNDFTYILNYDYNLERCTEGCRIMWLRVIQSAKEDYILFRFAQQPADRALWHMAKDFLFDDNYTIMLGNKEVNLKELLSIYDIDLEGARSEIEKDERKANEGKDFLPHTQLDLF